MIIYTSGHSNGSFQEFMGLLVEARVNMIVDVPASPKSGSNPQFNLSMLALELSQNAIDTAATRSEFDKSLDGLLAEAAHGQVCIMCAETVWWRCHRRIIADYFSIRGVDVTRI